jgi:hypothetical protein
MSFGINPSMYCVTLAPSDMAAPVSRRMLPGGHYNHGKDRGKLRPLVIRRCLRAYELPYVHLV